MRLSARAIALVLCCMGVVTVVAGCAQTAQPVTSQAAAKEQSWDLSKGATDNKAAFDATMQQFRGDKLPDPSTVVKALEQDGVQVSQIQITPSKTPTNGKTDQVTVSVLLTGKCIIGQFVPNGYNSTVADPVSGHCLIGDTAQLQ